MSYRHLSKDNIETIKRALILYGIDIKNKLCPDFKKQCPVSYNMAEQEAKRIKEAYKAID